MSGTLSGKTVLRCFLRSGMLNSVYNSRGLQSLGFLYSVLPGLRELHSDDVAFARSCARYSRHFNCHVVWAPFLCGAFLNAEKQIADGIINEDFVDMFKDTTLNSLSAIGDSFISGSLVVAVMLVMSCMVIIGNLHALWIFALLWILLALFIKVLTFYTGLTKGFSTLRQIRRLNLVNKGDNLKILNGSLLSAFLALALGFPPSERAAGSEFMLVLQSWYLPIAVMVMLGYATTRIHLSRTLAVSVMVIAASIFI